MKGGNKKEVPEHKTTFEMEVIWNCRKAIFKVSGISDLGNVDQSAPLTVQVIFFSQ